MIKILFFSDVFGRPGRGAVRKFIEQNRDSIRPDLVIANCDNAAAGRGPTIGVYEELLESGIDILTCGDHIWDQREITNILSDKKSKLIRPINYPAVCPGDGSVELEIKGQKVLIICALGRIWTAEGLESPFAKVEDAIERSKAKIIFVDFHGEATSEKCAFGHYFASKASAVVGTHTHIQTCDEKIIDEYTAYISDVGFCGPSDSVIGVKKEQSIHRFLTGMPATFEVADGPAQVNAVVIDIDEKTGRATAIERINEIV
jgi:hypothetical protein